MAMSRDGKALDYDLPDTRNQEIQGQTPGMVILFAIWMSIDASISYKEFWEV
jgi:hypothetical protein